jgi:drug/metabolite transporter (DMT)-like permease
MLVPIVWIVWHTGGLVTLKVSSASDQCLRALLAAGSTVLVVTSLSVLPLAEVISLLFIAPLFVTALAKPLLRETVGWRRWAAVFVGFVGVLVMLRPGEDAFQVAALLPIAAAFLGALRDIVTRRISATEHTTAIATWSTLALAGTGFATLPFGWQPLDATDVGIAALAGLLFGAGHYLIIEGYKYAEAAVVSPYRYTDLLWAAIFGFILWGELPSLWLLAGAPLIIGSGVYMALHERYQSSLRQA